MALALGTTRDQLNRAHDRIDELSMALTLALTTKPDAVERIRERAYPGSKQVGRYTLSLYGARRAMGGYVVVRFDYPGQRPSISARVFDVYRDEFGVKSHPQFAVACERLAITRQRLLDTKGPFRPGER